MTGMQNGKYFSKLCFSSVEFDPLMAINSPDMEFPKLVRPLDNISKCGKLIPPANSLVNGVLRPTKKKTPAESKEKAGKEKQKTMRRNVGVEQKSELIDASRGMHSAGSGRGVPRLEEKFISLITECGNYGPFSLLKKWKNSGDRVIIRIRSASKLRGFCTGIIEAFDKHMNMVLRDVSETYIPFHKRKQKKGKKNVYNTRQMKRLFVKGDNVVTVSVYVAAAVDLFDL